MRIRHLGISCILMFMAACGKDTPDFQDLKDEVGAVPGQFNVRLGKAYRGQVQDLQQRVEGFLPGISAKIASYVPSKSGDVDDEGSQGFVLSDLLKINIPATESTFINQRLFSELSRLGGDAGPWFDVVDMAKYLKGPKDAARYVPPENSKDAEIAAQYYLEMIRWYEGVQGIDARLADAAPVVVAVLDTGVHALHEDLSGALWRGTDSEVGYDATTDRVLAAQESDDQNGHGTHVAGIIAGIGGNGKGIHGVASIPGRGGKPDQRLAEVMNVRVLNGNGAGTSDQLAAGIKWAVNQHWKQKKAVATRSKQKMVLNMSLGGPFEVVGYDYKKDASGNYVFQDDMINYATAHDDVLVVVAAGNESCDIGGSCKMFGQAFQETYYYPCSYKGVLCVAASTHEDKLAGFSNRRGSVALTAPGFQILSTIVPSGNANYGYYSGTSQATPVAAAAAAVIWALYPDYSAADVKAILQKSAAPVAEITQQIANGTGRLDLKAALAYAASLGGKAPSTADQPVVDASKPTVDKAPPVDPAIDPYAPSANAYEASREDKGKGSAQGCAVVGMESKRGSWVMLMLLMAGAMPWLWTAWRSKAR